MDRQLKSTDSSLKIYISEESRRDLFKMIDEIPDGLNDILSAENLERYCLGKTHLADSAYSQIRRLLKKEYKEYKEQKKE